MSSIKRIIIICLTTLIILPMGVRAAGVSVDIGGKVPGQGGPSYGSGGGGEAALKLANSYAIRFGLVNTANGGFNQVSYVYYVANGNYAGKPNDCNGYRNIRGCGAVIVSKLNNGKPEHKQETLNSSNVVGISYSSLWATDAWGANVDASKILSYFDKESKDGIWNLSVLLGYLKVGSNVWNRKDFDGNAWEIQNMLNDPNRGCDRNECARDKLLQLKDYIITIEPVFRFQDTSGPYGSPTNYLFTTTKGYALCGSSNWCLQGASQSTPYFSLSNTIGDFNSFGGFCNAVMNVYSSYGGANPIGRTCNISYGELANPRNGYGMGVIKISEVTGNIQSCDPNTQCCYNATGDNIVQNGTHYNDSNGKRQPCCDKKKSCCYSAPNDNSYHREFSDEDDYDDVRYKKVNNSFKECSNCKPKVTTTACDDNPNAASIVESDKVDICTFDKSKKSGIKLSSGGKDVTAACRDELIVNTPGKKDTSSYKSGNYFILDKNKNLMPSISVKRQCYVKKDSSFNENLQKTKLDIKKAPKVNFYYDNDEESKNDIAKSFSFSPEITRLDTTYYDLGNNYNNSNKTLISDVSNVSSNNYVLREETMDITYKSKAYVKALTGKVTYIKPNDSDIDSYYESEDNSVFVSYKTKNSTYNYTLKFDFGNLGNDNLNEELKENKLFKNDNNYTCTYLVKNNLVINGEKLNYFYRTVDLDNINHKNRKLGSNWEATKYDNKNDCIIKNKDQASRKSCLVQLDMKNKEKSYKELTEQGDSYSFRLTPMDMKAIRKYNVERNKNSDGFNDFNLEKYDNPNYKYIFYTSNFLTCISGSECKNLGTSLNNYLDGKDRNNQINSIRNSLVSKLDELENITK